MASDLNLSRFGSIENGADGTYALDNELFLTVFAGETLRTFGNTCIMKGLHPTKVMVGKEMEYPVLGSTTARYQKIGEKLVTTRIASNKVTIRADEYLNAAVEIHDLDEAKTHYDIRAPYSDELGIALAEAFDDKTMRVALKAARSDAFIDDPKAFGGSVIARTNADTDAEVLQDIIFEAVQTLEEKNIRRTETRNLIMRPAQYYLLHRAPKVLNRDYGGSGSISENSDLRIAGVNITMSNLLPKAVYTKQDGENNDYSGNFTKTVALLFTPRAIMTASVRELQTSMSGDDYKFNYNATAIKAQYALGHCIVRPDCAIEIAKV